MSKPKTSDALEALIDAIGLPDTLRAIESMGGTRWYVPRQALPEDHPWVIHLGAAVAERLRAAFEGEPDVRIPRDKGVLDALIARDYAFGRGLGQNELAMKYRMDRRTIQKALARHRERRAAAAQGDVWELAM